MLVVHWFSTITKSVFSAVRTNVTPQPTGAHRCHNDSLLFGLTWTLPCDVCLLQQRDAVAGPLRRQLLQREARGLHADLCVAETSSSRGLMPFHLRLLFRLSLYLSLSLPWLHESCVSSPYSSFPGIRLSVTLTTWPVQVNWAFGNMDSILVEPAPSSTSWFVTLPCQRMLMIMRSALVWNCSSCLMCRWNGVHVSHPQSNVETTTALYTLSFVNSLVPFCWRTFTFSLPSAWMALWILDEILLSCDPSAEIVLPRYLKLSTHISWTPFMVMFGWGWIVCRGCLDYDFRFNKADGQSKESWRFCKAVGNGLQFIFLLCLEGTVICRYGFGDAKVQAESRRRSKTEPSELYLTPRCRSRHVHQGAYQLTFAPRAVPHSWRRFMKL